MEKVLVTGATGYIGLHCVNQLLNQGYAVNGSVRSPERKEEVINALHNHNTSTEYLNLYALNLTEDVGWSEDVDRRSHRWQEGSKSHNSTSIN